MLGMVGLEHLLSSPLHSTFAHMVIRELDNRRHLRQLDIQRYEPVVIQREQHVLQAKRVREFLVARWHFQALALLYAREPRVWSRRKYTDSTAGMDRFPVR